MNDRKVFSALRATALATVAAGGLLVLAGCSASNEPAKTGGTAGEKAGAGEKACSGDKKCGGEKSCGEKSCGK